MEPNQTAVIDFTGRTVDGKVADMNGREISFTIDDPNIVLFTEGTRTIKALKPGVAKITGTTTEGLSKSVYVIVKEGGLSTYVDDLNDFSKF